MEGFVEVDSKKIIRILADEPSCEGCYFKIETPNDEPYKCRVDFDDVLLGKLLLSEIAHCCVDMSEPIKFVDFIYVESEK